MNQILNRLSFLSGIIILLSPIVFTLIFKLVFAIPIYLTIILHGGILNTIFFAIVSMLEITYFLIVLRTYHNRDPQAFFIIYSLGVLTMLGILGSLFLGNLQFLPIFLKLTVVAIFFFLLFVFHYQKYNFLISNYSTIIQNVSKLLVIAIAIATIRPLLANILLLRKMEPFSLFLAALLILPFGYWWRKKVQTGPLRSFLFLPAFQIIATDILFQLTIFWNLFYRD